ncbi:WhiB family transcriptional regulator [Streptomyces sp. NPDC086519]|uniref:WhiB family transcriptional regulator n=1 Tax=Streptomyces sp. NPDC086519 TaxID=3154863 RepID=UPI00342FAD91
MSADRYAWMDDALCAQADPDTWIDLQPGAGSRQPKRICGACPVRDECGTHSQQLHTYDGLAPEGVWGGLSKTQRKRVRRAAA